MSVYKVGDRLLYLQGGYLVEIIEVKPFGFGGAQYRVKNLDEGRIVEKWVNHRKFAKLCSNSRAAHILHNSKVTKAVQDETNG
jgi:hypothetical protein